MFVRIGDTTYVVDPLDKEATIILRKYEQSCPTHSWLIVVAPLVVLALTVLLAYLSYLGMMTLVDPESASYIQATRKQDAQMAAGVIGFLGTLGVVFLPIPLQTYCRKLTITRFQKATKSNRITALTAECYEDLKRFLEEQEIFAMVEDGHYTLCIDDVRILKEANEDYRRGIVDSAYREGGIRPLIAPFLHRVKTCQQAKQQHRLEIRKIYDELATPAEEEK